VRNSSLILVVGLTGAGKTTYCDKLHAEKVGHAFSIDRWMKSLYWQDMPHEPKMEWFQKNQKWYIDRIQRCERMISKEVVMLLKLGVSCILDLGFTSSAHRKKYIDLGLDNNSNVELHFLDIKSEQRWSRVLKRNQEKAETFSMHVDRQMFEYMETNFEAITEAEKSYVNLIKK